MEENAVKIRKISENSGYEIVIDRFQIAYFVTVKNRSMYIKNRNTGKVHPKCRFLQNKTVHHCGTVLLFVQFFSLCAPDPVDMPFKITVSNKLSQHELYVGWDCT